MTWIHARGCSLACEEVDGAFAGMLIVWMIGICGVSCDTGGEVFHSFPSRVLRLCYSVVVLPDRKLAEGLWENQTLTLK